VHRQREVADSLPILALGVGGVPADDHLLVVSLLVQHQEVIDGGAPHEHLLHRLLPLLLLVVHAEAVGYLDNASAHAAQQDA
jgi:hypothetical protein